MHEDLNHNTLLAANVWNDRGVANRLWLASNELSSSHQLHGVEDQAGDEEHALDVIGGK
jgi:hypothetical protein